ncbi:hypothetical protein BAE44_0002665 [Dichanthelium oligosanthes]|uniref:DUF1618 domain-containing protein n=1 Tax=Dichanthelium oligosanthes TaxID=888268 RepID=A0A1E5WFZ6_9POAL|nr:hypothetical protein BAE44_0002665 [Dichanthelium oligosanthes]
MAAPRRSAPLYVLNGSVNLDQLTGEPPGQGWTRIECASKKAYGCGEHVQEAVQGLTLYARLGDAPLVTSSLAIRMSDEALRRFDSEPGGLGAPREETHKMDARGRILVVEQDLMVIAVSSADLYQATSALKPVTKRTVGGSFELLLMARELTPGSPAVLCVFSPPAWANPACPWQKKGRRFPPGKVQEPLMGTVAFSFQGKGFWADLAQGLVYCDLQATIDPAVDFGFIELPRECQLDLRQWKKERRFSARELWGFDGFKEAGLPEAPPEFPVLTADGGLCVVLTDQHRSFAAGRLDLIVIMLIFHRECRGDLFYFLVYDDVDASLSSPVPPVR